MIKLSDDLQHWRADRPSEWLMDEFIKKAKEMETIINIVQKLPFGQSVALPWCRESFPELDEAIKKYEKGR